MQFFGIGSKAEKYKEIRIIVEFNIDYFKTFSLCLSVLIYATSRKSARKIYFSSQFCDKGSEFQPKKPIFRT